MYLGGSVVVVVVEVVEVVDVLVVVVGSTVVVGASVVVGATVVLVAARVLGASESTGWLVTEVVEHAPNTSAPAPSAGRSPRSRTPPA